MMRLNMKMLKFLKWQNTLIFFLMIAVVLLLFNGSVSAAETPLKVYKNNDQIKVTNYSVVPVFANNQDKNKAGYWHVKLSPKKGQVLRFKIITGNNPGNFDLSLNNAFTNRNLAVDYSNQAKNNQYGKLDFNFAKQAVFLKNKRNKMHLKLPANHTAEVLIKLNKVKKSVNGAAVGGLHVVNLNKASTTNSVTSQIAYSYAITAQMGTSNKTPLRLRLKNIKQTSNKHFINYTIVNPNNKLLQHAKIVTKIYDVSGKLIQKDVVSKQATLTPHTKINFKLKLQDTSRTAKKVQVITWVNGNKQAVNKAIY